MENKGNYKNKSFISKENVATLFESRFIRVFDLQYAPGKHYYDATRRKIDDLVALKSEEEFRAMLPDAVSCVVILDMPDGPKLLLSYEFRYPAGQYLLSVPAGLIDETDKEAENPLFSTAIREIEEETGLKVCETDTLATVSPLLFSTPGMTDESNALVCAVLRSADISGLSQEGASGSEKFSGFALLTKDEATELLKKGCDEAGNYYSIFTWAALMYFVSGLWKQGE